MINKLLKLIAKHEIYEAIWWNQDLNFYIDCNDVFYAATSDAEPIKTEEDLQLLEQSINDADEETGTLLYCARKRKRKPKYYFIDDKYQHFFDEFGE